MSDVDEPSEGAGRRDDSAGVEASAEASPAVDHAASAAAALLPARQAMVGKAVLLILALGISWLFWGLVQPFALALLMAAVLSGLCRPLELRLRRAFGGRAGFSSSVTLLVVVLALILPAFALGALIVTQALQVSESAKTWITDRFQDTDNIAQQANGLLRQLPFIGELVPSPDELLRKLGQLTEVVGKFLVKNLATATAGTANFLLQLGVMLYAMFFFLLDGDKALRKLMYLSPLRTEQELALVSRFVSVTRATLKGTLVVGFVQGGLAGLAFAVVGIEGAVFWGTIMALLSVIPALGTPIIWIPAAAYLALSGELLAAGGLVLWCALVVGSADNVLRPMLVGRDTQMSDLLVLLSTLGGIGLFGVVGVVVGPVIAGLFLTVWEQYGEAFREYLPEVGDRPTVRPRT